MGNLKEQIESIMNKMKNDPTFEAKFKEDPVKAIENLMDIDLPNDAIDDIIAGIKAKIGIEESGIMDILGQIDAGDVIKKLGKLDDNGVLGKIKGLFE